MSTTNSLIYETSPYLLQHATNPVAWYPWSEKALTLAKEQHKPILLSIGYSACHWCHVMAHESFADAKTAALMNAHFINIKVDREERPDLDKIYQTAQQLLNRRTGGWPLTMFLMPENQVPFFGGTYFPPEPRHGLPGFKALLIRINAFYQNERATLLEQNASFLEALRQTEKTETPDEAVSLDIRPIQRAIAELKDSYDPRDGGFGPAPKFPHPTHLDLLLKNPFTEGPAEARENADMACLTLQKMAQGGIHDQLGGGFCRYSIDAHWRIPHFEKMLYDNGPLLALYADAFHITQNALFERTSYGIANWVMREMQSAEGGYFSSLDADSEGEEGKFYVWDKTEIQSLLTDKEYALIARHYGLDKPANFEGRWHLHVNETLDDMEKTTSQDIKRQITNAANTLFHAREKRIRPGRDEKMLTSWNALMIKGMITAALRLQEDKYYDSAARCLAFIHAKLWDGERLRATCKDGRAHFNAYLDDYAFLIDAILHVLSYRWSGKWLSFSMQLADTLIEQFYDQEQGGFFFTSHDHEALLQRRKDFMDDSLPSGNGIATLALLNLGHLTGERRYLAVAEQTLKCSWTWLGRLPHACHAMLLALLEFNKPKPLIIIRGEPSLIDTWQNELRSMNDMRAVVFAIADKTQHLPALLRERWAQGKATAFICEGSRCLEPVHDLHKLKQLLIHHR